MTKPYKGKKLGPVPWLTLALLLVCYQAHGAAPARGPAPQSGLTAVRLQGKISSSQAGCSDAMGGAMAHLMVQGMADDFATATVECKFLPWSTVANARFVVGLAGMSSQPSLDFLDSVYRAEGSPAAIKPVVYFNATGDSGFQYSVTCQILPGLGEVAPVLLADTTHTNTRDPPILVLPSSPMSRVAIKSMQPALGPSSGSTDILLEGEGFTEGSFCIFSNRTDLVNVTAVVANATSAVCTAPAWPVGLGTAQVTLTAVTGRCANQMAFEYYQEPAVMSVFPLQGPRYGSFQLTVHLGDSLDELAILEQEGMWPVVRIVGADVNGSDLLLPANVTTDRKALMTETPLDKTPLSRGDHQIEVSLNGQQYGVPLLDPATLTVEGPFLLLSQHYFHLADEPNAAAAIPVGVALQGMNTLPVSANLSVSQRVLLGNSTLETGTIDFLLSAYEVTWDAGETGERNVTLFVTGDTVQLAQGALLISIESATNADVDVQNSTAVVTAVDASELMLGFAVKPNQVVYRGGNARVPIAISNAEMRLPAAVSYTISLLNGDAPPYIPANLTEGFLQWDLESGDTMTLDIPITWDNVSYQTEDHLLVTLSSAWNARVPAQQKDVALHVFGVQADQCPPGTFRFSTSPAPPPPRIAQPPRSSPPATAEQADGWLQSLVVRGGDSWSFDLSSQFQPDVAEYGVIVPSTFDNATLCVLPYDNTAVVRVQNSAGQLVAQSSAVGTPTITNLSPMGQEAVSTVSGRKRRLQGVPVPTEGPSLAAEQAGVNAIASKVPGNDSSVCGRHSWLLGLQPGRNDFSVNVATPAVLEVISVPPPPPPHSAKKGKPVPHIEAPAPAPSVNGTYTISVVRLADPSHAEMIELNVTHADGSFAVCSDDPNMLTAADLDDAEADASAPPCTPNQPMHLNVSSDTDWVTLHPGLRFPDVQGLRVEVSGQVLSQGGNVGADQVADTTTSPTIRRNNTDFLPYAIVVGLSSGVPAEVPIVVVAEDSVTSLHYFLYITRALPEDNGTAAGSVGSPESVLPGTTLAFVSERSADALERRPPPPPLPVSSVMEKGWPLPPSRQPGCNTCPSGWASTGVDQTHCEMCTPGSFAQAPQSPACLQCVNGTYANSWGSTHCNHCIMGTYAPYLGSKLCYMCPENMTNLEDGSSACLVPLMPGTNLTMRWAVIVSFGVYLNGTSLDEIAAKVGVNASSKVILERLIRTDTATAFNITAQDVNVTGISQVARRVLLVNVTATLGVDLPPGTAQEDIEAELEVKNLSADDAIDMLASQPDRFLGRTTKALDVTAEPGGAPPTRTESRPLGAAGSDLLIPWYAVMLLCLAAVALLAAAARIWRRRTRHLLHALLHRCWPGRMSQLEEARGEAGGEEAAGELPDGAGLSAAGLTSRGKGSSKTLAELDPMFAGGEYSDGTTRR